VSEFHLQNAAEGAALSDMASSVTVDHCCFQHCRLPQGNFCFGWKYTNQGRTLCDYGLEFVIFPSRVTKTSLLLLSTETTETARPDRN